MQPTNAINRNRLLYSTFILATIILGIASRKFGASLPAFIADYAGDTLWALMVYFLFGFALNQKPIQIILLFSLAFCFGIEISQLYQAEWINNIRSTTAGGLVLGHSFLWSDLVCYSVGVLMGTVGEILLLNKQKRNN